MGEALAEFKNRDEYLNFLSEYQDTKDELEEVKHQLADN
jgi:hypothetical protein